MGVPEHRYVRYRGAILSDFRCQLELEMEDDEVVHDKRHHQKGIPTYYTTLRQIENLCSDSFGYSVYLEVTSTSSSLEKKPHFIRC